MFPTTTDAPLYQSVGTLTFVYPPLLVKLAAPRYYKSVLFDFYCIWPQAAHFNQATHFYPTPAFEEPRLRLHMAQGRRAHVRFSLLAPVEGSFHPLFLITGALAAAAAGLGKAARFTSLAQLFSCQLLRRFLLSLGSPLCDLWVRGGLTNFSLLWRHIRQPLDEIFWNPLSASWVFDVRLRGSDVARFSAVLSLSD